MVVYDLVQTAPAADAEFPWEYLAFGTLAAAPFQEKGFERTAVEPFSDSYAVVKSRPQVLLRWSAPKVASVELPPGSPSLYFPCFTVRYEFAAKETQMSS